ncbi:MAG TPA: hypothetical protein ENN09_00175, partial [Planctomycetes bacterium]|nr:hypothetical protein [Planctomycetota bacterium]
MHCPKTGVIPTADVVTERIPEGIRSQAEAVGIRDKDVLFAVRSDLALDAKPSQTWLIVTPGGVITFAAGGAGAPPTGPFPLAHVSKVWIRQTVGSAFLQFMIEGMCVDVIRFSNGLRDAFNTARIQLEKLTAGKEPEKEAFENARRRICPDCGLPFSRDDERCPHCGRGHSITLKALALMKPYWGWSLLVFLL